MALIKCPECGKELGSFADRCPNCRCPMSIIKEMIKEPEIKKAQILKPYRREGNSIYFGLYYQSNDKDKESIKWNILKVENGKALIITDKIIDAMCFDHYSSDYNESEIRRWLNNDFYERTFNDEEKELIEKSFVDNSLESTMDDNNKNVCKNTKDKVFLLSVYEAKGYYRDEHERIAQGTEYALRKGLGVNLLDDNSPWWLRSPDIDDYCIDARCVSSDGCIPGEDVRCPDCGVRPALWIKL